MRIISVNEKIIRLETIKERYEEGVNLGIAGAEENVALLDEAISYFQSLLPDNKPETPPFDIMELPELKGQVVDIFEDFFAENDINIPNEDRDQAIADGEDPDGLAIIYGEDYDVIGDEVELAIGAETKTLSENEMNDLADTLIEAAKRLDITDAERNKVQSNRDELIKQIKELFAEWELYGEYYYVTHRVDGRYTTKVFACSVDDAIEKARRDYEEANFGEVEIVEGYANIVENENGDILWDRA